jgi:transcriptional regulator with XRE-family HTH domain
MNVSARDMSLSLGQSPNYINNIENHNALPSMQMFLYICEYFKITPKEFFDESVKEPVLVEELIKLGKKLNHEQLETLISFLKKI